MTILLIHVDNTDTQITEAHVRGAKVFDPVFLTGNNSLGTKIVERRDKVLDAVNRDTEFVSGRIFVLLNITFQEARYRDAKNFDIAFAANREIEGNTYLYRLAAAAFVLKKELIP